MSPIGPIPFTRLMGIIAALLLLMPAQAQITIGGNVYGGGNEGEVTGNGSVTVKEGTFTGNVYGGGNHGDLNGTASVTLRGGDFQGSVFGGSRIANVGKFAYVNIDGAGQLHDITANYIYGGNDIAGHVGDYLNSSDVMPFTPEVNNGTIYVDRSWQSYILATKERTLTAEEKTALEQDQLGIYVGQMYGGGNGDYTYPTAADAESGKWIIKDKTNTSTVAELDAQPNRPIVAKTYMQVNGGTYGNVYAGGNAATVTEQAVISINNASEVTHKTKHLNVAGFTPIEALDIDNLNNTVDERLMAMGLNLSTFNNDRQFINIFGGNNKADMAIRPVWNLQKGSVHNLYSGGNEGRMTNPEGILLEIKATSQIVADNVYGGCRKADVRPLYPSGADVPTRDIQLADPTYKFPKGFSARVLVRGGTITNVYGGNDISGNVWGGNAVGIYTSITGDVYGGGNGSYSYTDNKDLKDDIVWGDYYYDPSAYKGRDAGGTFTEAESVEALTALRPNAEQVSIRVYGGDDDTKPIFIGGSIFVGGNSASIKPQESNPIENPQVHLKIGSNVMADNVFLGNNGEQMVDASDNGVLARYAGTVIGADKKMYDFSLLDLTHEAIFAKYMEGCAMEQIPGVVFDSERENGDPATYRDYTTKFGSVFCGGNIGSMILDGVTELNFRHPIVIFNKLVGGCNNANVPAHDGLNARFEGGFMTPGSNGPTVGATTPIADKLILNISGVDIRPMRWVGTKDGNGNYTSYTLDANGIRQLEWNTINARTGEEVTPPTGLPATTNSDGSNTTEDDLYRRLTGGNVYGGCYNSGHIDGNVVINLNGTILNRWNIFDEVEENENGEAALYDNDNFTILDRHSGVILDRQGMDVLGTALNVFGGGYGADSEIWGSTTINLNQGYTFQIFGGGEHGAVGKGVRNASGKLEYSTYDPRFSCYVNMDGPLAGSQRSKTDKDEKPTMADTEFIYGGGFMGTIAGNTVVHLGNGRIFNSFAGSCNADILGHTETYVGINADEELGFPYVRDHIYGGNDLGGRIRNLGNADFTDKVREDFTGIKSSIHDAAHSTQAAAYIEYRRGRVDHIFGGCYGDYDYTNTELYGDYITADGSDKAGFSKPRLGNAFVNFRPDDYTRNAVSRIYGAGQGHLNGIDMNIFQQRSYVLIDIPQTIEHNFENLDVFGAGNNCGLGMEAAPATAAAAPDQYSAVIDLFRGNIRNVYGASYNGGVTRRTMVNVPTGSTVKLDNIFGGAYGSNTFLPCDVYEANVNFNSDVAFVSTAIYGGNNNERRTLYGKVNINAPVHSDPSNLSYMATVYGAGYGANTWSEYTEVNLNRGAQVYEVYGGGQMGKVQNAESIQHIMNTNAFKPAVWPDGNDDSTDDVTFTAEDWKKAWLLGQGYDPAPYEFSTTSTSYTSNDNTNLNNPLVTKAEIDQRETKTYKYNTNVIINEGATVAGYAYGGGLGKDALVAGSTYIALCGGTVVKDLYAAGTSGSVEDQHGAKTFTASANAYIKGGTVRNVYGGGWKGSVGHHDGVWKVRKDKDGKDEDYVEYATATTNDIPGETYVVIGKRNEDNLTLTNGIPAIQRNVYGGGEGGPVFGYAYVVVNNGYVGYTYNAEGSDDPETTDYDEHYEEKINDETWTDHIGLNRLYDSGCIFGGGYIDNSSVDHAYVKMFGGNVRNSLFGGGEIAAIGRGEVSEDRTLKGIYKAGSARVCLIDGHVFRDVFCGGRGYNNLGERGTLYTDGFVFGRTEVHIHGGEIGTEEGVAQGYGNVFGGGDIGYVYSAYERADGTLCYGKKSGTRFDDGDEGYYYKYEDDAFVTETHDGVTEKIKTEDCRVLVEPQCLVETPVTINGVNYKKGEYVQIEALQTLGNKNDAAWSHLDMSGVVIHNAIFAGGNTSSGSDQVYVNTTTVFGNATASIHDVYHRDLVTIGLGHIGGLYGDGNLTFVDGYRGLNITNYGTDYYSIQKEISLAAYKALPAREAAYYELRYKCKQECTDKDGRHYTVGSTITTDELLTQFEGITVTVDGEEENMIGAGNIPHEAYWEENGVCSRYAGRPLNTIQRADFCGVWGSRMVMQGAQDRVPEIVDYTNYTINRVREVSLNKKVSKITADIGTDNAYHGNYFGIYSVVNHLGALTSDFDFGDETSSTSTEYARTSDNKDKTTYGPDLTNQTFYDWKKQHYKVQKRNNGNSHNQVALASGVYLELTTEKSRGTGLYEKDWGMITGVIELDLINVQTGIGGGFVYAKNVHGVRSRTNRTHITITDLNQGAVSKSEFSYATDDANKKEWQTSGNFVHSTQTIVDDCYNISGKYKGKEVEGQAVPAHYWYIKGSVYVYDQYISAYTGAPNAYSEKVNIPLTITAASNGTMKLLNVKPNRYAYYSHYTSANNNTPLGTTGSLIINDVTYKQNTPISYWDWYLLSPSEKNLFVEDTYVVTADCKIDSKEYSKGTVLLKSEYDALNTTTPPTVLHKNVAEDGTVSWEKKEGFTFDFVFRSSNNLSHDTGYILTYDVNNPKDWDRWYTEFDSSTHAKLSTAAYNDEDGYNNGPTYHLKGSEGGVLGQLEYHISDIISQNTKTTYDGISAAHLPSGQATFQPAYVVTEELETVKTNGTPQHLYPGATLVEEDYSADTWSAMSGSVAQAYVCTSSIQLNKTDYIYVNSILTQKEIDDYKDAYPDLTADINSLIVPAYYCTSPGLYGGNYYESGKNYRGLEAWSSMSPKDRELFDFNYDAFDVLIDPSYGGIEGQKYQYDTRINTATGAPSPLEQAKTNLAGYSMEKPVDYTATYNGASAMTYLDKDGVSHSVAVDQELDRETYEAIPNEKHHYAAIDVKEAGNYYIVNTGFQRGDTPYTPGQSITQSVYDGLGDDQSKVTVLTFAAADKNKTFYFCRDSYEIWNNDEGHAITSYTDVVGATGGDYVKGATVPVGVVITSDLYTNTLVNKQKDFTIHGIAPIETSTFYVSRNSDINDLSTEKIITVIYQYDYEESDESGTHITPISERHVVNIHIEFKSGIPTVEDINAPKIVIPGTAVSLRTPMVTPGAYEVTGGGWELFEKEEDAESHSNGISYTAGVTPLYLYQDGYYTSYYAMSYLGKTYSNYVKVSVANYHDIASVMNDKQHHYYIDHKNVPREPKIYINDYSNSETPQNGIDLFRQLIDLTHVDNYDASGNPVAISEGELEGHVPLDLTHADKPMRGGKYLEFFLQSDQSAPAASAPSGFAAWTPIANGDNECFSGTLHGDGYTVSGLDHSLFNHLCGNVYNLGVTGSFTGAGVAETGEGYVENCWITTTGTPAKAAGENHFAVFADPSRLSGDARGTIQVVNCYYPVSNDYQKPEANDIHGKATQMPDADFYNGTVAYDLNGFYLNKRFYDSGTEAASSVLGASGAEEYSYFDGTTSTLTKTTGRYPAAPAAQYGDLGYVKDRFTDGDFIYAGGTIPDASDVRLSVEDDGPHYYPIWPDDYLFFGQMLTYGHVENRPHQPLPAHINKSAGRLTTTATSINRVYRAPAYFRSSAMGVAHYNPYAVFAAKSADETRTAYPGMTAIDFTGHADNTWVLGSSPSGSSVSGGSAAGTPAFYPPLLDNDGLTRFQNIDLTKNLLVYIPEATSTTFTGAASTNSAVNTALNEPAYAETNTASTPDTYRAVAMQDDGHVYGHPVELIGSTYTALKDHFLVDRQDFNAPIAYTFDTGERMFYQRTPDTYVDRIKGWEGVSLPFTAELVTTQDKGEITHFYSGSTSEDATTHTKVGHEYWLREFGGNLQQKKDESNNPIAGVYTADFGYPVSSASVLDGFPVESQATLADKSYTNTFLWDHYYSVSLQRDENQDKYQTYYKGLDETPRTYSNYAYARAAQPYLIGFPGTTYYEFDLSGSFKPLNTFADIDRLDQQIITFASAPATTIGVSDDELTASATANTHDGYVFKASYMTEDLPATTAFALNADGSAFDAVSVAGGSAAGGVTVQPFRPYFTVAPSSHVKEDALTRSITFGTLQSTFGGNDEQPSTGDAAPGLLDISARRHRIIVTSYLDAPTTVHIVTTAGALVSTYDIEPGETVITNVPTGIYLVNRKKIAVK